MPDPRKPNQTAIEGGWKAARPLVLERVIA